MKSTELNPDVVFTIRYAMEKRAEAKALEDKADVIRKEADEVLLPLLATLDDMRVEDTEFGAVQVVTQKRSTFGQDKAKETLLSRGVPVGVITAAWEAAVSYTESTSVRYTRPKVGK